MYLGIMITADGPMVLELNCRLGDPETQVILPSMDGDLAALCAGAAAGDLLMVPRPLHVREALCVVVASTEYPEPSESDVPLGGIECAGAFATVFHAGTSCDCKVFHTNRSGRILSVVGVGETLAMAHERAYKGVGEIIPSSAYRYRTDIGATALAKLALPSKIVEGF